MKTNTALHNKIGFKNPGQKVWYAAHVLLSACTNSPAIKVRDAVPAVIAKPAVIAQTAKPARPASAAVLAAANTTGYGFGELYLNSPAYPAGTAIPAITAKPASTAVIGAAAVVGVPAITAVSSPAIVAIKGWEDAIEITQSADTLTVIAELPVYGGVRIVGSNKLVIGEITPSALQANDFLQSVVSSYGQSVDVADNLSDTTLEQVFYRNALQCEHTIIDTIRNGINCKKITITLYGSPDFDASSDDLQLIKISSGTWISPLGEIEAQFPHPSVNKGYSTEQSWIDYVQTTPPDSPERAFVSWVASNYPNGYSFFTFAEADLFYDPEIYRINGGSMGDWHFYHFVLK